MPTPPKDLARKPLPASLYAETARPPVATPPLAGEASAAVAVIGAGFTGLSAALHLAEAGVDVAVLEAHEPGWGASGRNGGQVNPGLKYDPDEIERQFGAERGGRMVRFSGEAPGFTFALIARHGIPCDAANTGTIRAAVSEGFAAEVDATTRQWERRGAAVEFLDRDKMAAIVGSPYYRCGFLDRRGGSVNPLGYARGLAEAVQKAGGRIFGATPALRVSRHGARWEIATPSGVLRADTLVIGTNGYSGSLWPPLAETIIPVYSGVAATEPLPPALAEKIMVGRPVLYENSWFFAYYRLDPQGRLLMGGRSRLADTSDPTHYRHLIRHTERIFPALAGVRWTHFWNGQLAITGDRYPHIHEPAPGVHIALGYNGRGVALATAVGAQLAKRILGARIEDIELPVTAMKPYPLHRFWKLGAAFRLVYGRLRSRLEA